MVEYFNILRMVYYRTLSSFALSIFKDIKKKRLCMTMLVEELNEMILNNLHPCYQPLSYGYFIVNN